MAKVKASSLPHYELLYIIANKFSDNEISPIKEDIEKLLSDNQGTIILRQDWGKRKLAYPIKHFRQGYYCFLEFTMLPANVKIVERHLRLSDQILRHQIVKKDEHTAVFDPRHQTMAETPATATNVSATTEIKPVAKPLAETDPAILQDLDKKLDQILDSESFF